MLAVGAFAIDRVPVTVSDYARFVAETRRAAPTSTGGTLADRHAWAGGEAPRAYRSHPVVLVRFDDAAAFCAWRRARLPTVEEFRAAAGSSAYPWGDEVDPTRVNSAEFGAGDTVPVASFPRAMSPLGLMDAAGNVAEWTASPGAREGERLVVGSAFDEPAAVGRVDRARSFAVDTRAVTLGFRCAMTRP